MRRSPTTKSAAMHRDLEALIDAGGYPGVNGM
jgi:hypothetical protein